MMKKLILPLFFLHCITILFAETAWSSEKIAVLPVEAVNEGLAEGALTFNSILTEHFMNSANILVITPEQYDALVGDLSASRLQVIKSVADKLNSGATLVITLHRFRQREGDNYSTDTPTSLAFKYHLIRSADGRSICTGSFDETQEALTDNILKLKSAFKRGFKWISVEEMAREALKSEFATCPPLSQ